MGVGPVVGKVEGLTVGEVVGLTVGEVVGLVVGETVGLAVGLVVGDVIGLVVGEVEGVSRFSGVTVVSAAFFCTRMILSRSPEGMDVYSLYVLSPGLVGSYVPSDCK